MSRFCHGFSFTLHLYYVYSTFLLINCRFRLRGQWRRCSLALSLGFSDLVARRGRLCSSLLVLDEPLTHLDSNGRDNVGRLLRKIIHSSNSPRSTGPVGGLLLSTIIIILQDLVAEELSESFDCIDQVVRSKGHSTVVVDE